MKINYRPEIDGLRAIAVLSVIFYHARLNILDYNFFKGGYLGVDIFFVISGYLITSEFKPTSLASTSVGFSSLKSLKASKSLCLNRALLSKVTFESTAMILSLEVFKTGLISNKEYHNRCIFDGYPRTLNQAKNLDNLIHKHNQKISLVLSLELAKV